MLSSQMSECNVTLMSEEYMYPKILLLPWQPLRKDKMSITFFLGMNIT